jgi:hypothetical protein
MWQNGLEHAAQPVPECPLCHRNPQKIKRKHLTLRPQIERVVRKKISFSKARRMPDIVFGCL